jgi:hypothetical protein
MPFAWAAGAAAIGGIASSAIGASASQSAANSESQSADYAAQLQQQQFQTTTNNLAPFLKSGTAANTELMSLLGYTPGTSGQAGTWGQGALTTPYQAYQPLTAQSFQASPGYQYELQQQQQAIQNSAASRGASLSGNTLMALQQNAQGLASQDWYNANNLNQSNYTTGFNANVTGKNQLFNFLQTMAGSGQNAGAQLGSLGSSAATAMGQDYMSAGSANAAGTIGAANAYSSGLNSAGNSLQQYLLYNQMYGSGSGGGGDAWSGAGTDSGGGF